jgi:phage/plasmid-like protein (TIGR03299 family)
VIRDNPITGLEEVIGTVGNDYVVKQNEELIVYMQDLLEQSGGQVTAAADYYGDGRQVFFTMELPMSTKVAGNDVINHNLTVFDGKDGSLSLTTVLTHLRVMCANMRSQALSSALASAKNRHTKNMNQRMTLAKQMLGLAIAEGRSFDEKADAMAQTRLQDDDFWGIVNQLWVPSTSPTKVAQTLTAKRNLELTEILHGPTLDNIKGSVWAGYSTITQYLQHPEKGTDEKNALRSLRASMLPTSDMAKLMRKTESLFLAQV